MEKLQASATNAKVSLLYADRHLRAMCGTNLNCRGKRLKLLLLAFLSMAEQWF